MKLSPNYWYLLQFASEFSIFGIVTAIFAKSKRISLGVPMKWWSFATVLTLVGWNIGMLVAFKLVLI